MHFTLPSSQYPGWTSTPDGALVMATVNDDTAGVYACTPYNSYGSMGPSRPTSVILQVSRGKRVSHHLTPTCWFSHARDVLKRRRFN